MARQYLDFDLAIEPADGGYVARVLRSPAGEAEAPFEWPFSLQDLEIFILRIGHTRRGTRRSDSPEMHHARDFGRTLYDTVFSGATRTALVRSIDEAERRDAGLRIRLRLGSSPQLNDVPWEFLYSDDLNRFLIVSSDTPLVRYVDLSRPPRPVGVDLPLHILAVVSDPTNLPELDVEGEWERLQQALGRLVRESSVTLERLEAPTLEKLQQRLWEDPIHVLHFIGHGAFRPLTDEGVLFFTNERGGSHAVTGENLGTVLHDHRSLRLVILNSCEGARSDPADPFSGAAQALVTQGIPAVIAMQFEITDQAALTIAKNFYGSLANGYAVDAALAEARKAIFSQGNDVEWGTPVLYMRSPDGQLFDIERGAPAPAVVDIEPESDHEALATARAAADRAEWGEVVSILEEAIDDAPEHLDAQALLEEARRQQVAANLYRGAGFLAAAEQWEAVLERFRDIDALNVTVDDPDQLRQQAGDAVEARRQIRWLDEQLARARAALSQSDWTVAQETAAGILQELPSHEEAQRIAAEATDRAAVAELYDLARQAVEEERFDQALQRLDDIEAIDVAYLDDTDQLRQRAAAGQAQRLRTQALATRYDDAVTLIDAEQWDQARSILDGIAADEPGYRGVEKLRDEVAAQMEAEQRAAAEAAAERRYVDAIRAAAAGDWDAVVAELDAIDQLAPGFGDPENLRTQAELAVAKARPPAPASEVADPTAPEVPESDAEMATVADPYAGTEVDVPTPPDEASPQAAEELPEPDESAAADEGPQARRLPAWLPGLLVLVAANLQWSTDFSGLETGEIPIGYPLGLREFSPATLNLRTLLLALAFLIAIQPYRYPNRPILRQSAAVAVLMVAVGAAISAAGVGSFELASGGPWLAAIGGAAAIPRKLPRFLRPSSRGGVLVEAAPIPFSLAVVGSLLILASTPVPWWAGGVTQSESAFDLGFHLYPHHGDRVFGNVLAITSLAVLTAAVVGRVRRRPLATWVGLVGLAVYVYAVAFQAAFMWGSDDVLEDVGVAPGIWLAALGGLLLAAGHRLRWLRVGALAVPSVIAFWVWSRAGPLAAAWWNNVGSEMEEMWVVGLVGLGASLVVASAIGLTVARIRPRYTRPTLKRWAQVIGASALAGFLVFAFGETGLDKYGGYWGSIVGSVVTLLALVIVVDKLGVPPPVEVAADEGSAKVL